MQRNQSVAHMCMPREIADDVQAFVEQLREEFGQELLSIVAFGPAVKGEYIHGKSRVNLLIVLNSAGSGALRLAAQAVTRWMRRLPLDPIIMTPHDLLRSRDVIPAELIEMHDQHHVLFGDGDPVNDIEIDGDTLRAELEHSFRRKLARLRSHYLRVASNERALVELLTESIDRYMALMTCLLYLRGKLPPSHFRELCTQIQFEFDLDAETLFTLSEVKMGKRRLQRGEAQPLFERYLHCVEKMVDIVDELAVAPAEVKVS